MKTMRTLEQIKLDTQIKNKLYADWGKFCYDVFILEHEWYFTEKLILGYIEGLNELREANNVSLRERETERINRKKIETYKQTS